MTIAIKCCRAVAELHSMEVVHGDLNSENILIDDKLDVKLIDFDNSSIEGSSVIAGGHPDFVTGEFLSKIENGKKIKSSFKNDLYSLALCCFLLLGDNEKKFAVSMTEELPLST